MIEQYEINASTLAIIPIDENTTQIVEQEEAFTISKNSLEVIDGSCRYFGSSFSGREIGAKSLIGSNYKVPIIVEETKRIIFIPLSSPKFSLCEWVSYQHIHTYERNGGKTKIIFDNGKEIEIKISVYSLENQILRAMKLENVLRNRISI